MLVMMLRIKALLIAIGGDDGSEKNVMMAVAIWWQR